MQILTRVWIVKTQKVKKEEQEEECKGAMKCGVNMIPSYLTSVLIMIHLQSRSPTKRRYTFVPCSSGHTMENNRTGSPRMGGASSSFPSAVVASVTVFNRSKSSVLAVTSNCEWEVKREVVKGVRVIL